MKKTLVLVLAIALLSACMMGCTNQSTPSDVPSSAATTENVSPSASTPEEKQIVIGVTLQDLSNEWIAMMKDAIVERANKYPGMEVQVVDAQGDANKQINQVETFISSHVDAIVICPRDADQLIPCCQEAVSKGIPVICASALLSKEVGQSTVTAANENGGKMLMQWVSDKLGGKGNIAIMRGPIGASAEIQRFAGFDSVIKATPGLQVVFDQTANWSREEAMTLMENWLSTGKQIDALVAQNDEMALGALQAIKAAGKLNDIIIVGMDGIADALDSVEAGELNCTAFQSAIGQGYGSIDTAYKAITGEKVEQLVDIGWTIVTEDNLDFVRKQTSLDTYQEN